MSYSWEVADVGFRSRLIRLQGLSYASSSKEDHSLDFAKDTDGGSLLSCFFPIPHPLSIPLVSNSVNVEGKMVSLPSPHWVYGLSGSLNWLRLETVWLGRFRFLNNVSTLLSWAYTDCNCLVLLSIIDATYMNISPKEYNIVTLL